MRRTGFLVLNRPAATTRPGAFVEPNGPPLESSGGPNCMTSSHEVSVVKLTAVVTSPCGGRWRDDSEPGRVRWCRLFESRLNTLEHERDVSDLVDGEVGHADGVQQVAESACQVVAAATHEHGCVGVSKNSWDDRTPHSRADTSQRHNWGMRSEFRPPAVVDRSHYGYNGDYFCCRQILQLDPTQDVREFFQGDGPHRVTFD